MAEIAEDQPLIEPGTAWIRQLWAPMIERQDYGLQGLHPALLDNVMRAHATLNIPTDFTSLNNLYLIVYPAATVPVTINVTISFGQNGQAWNTRTQAANVVTAMVAGVFTSIDLVTTFGALLANLAAGDHMFVVARNQVVTQITVYGLDARYS